MKVLLLGPPGAGKGTQAKFISDELQIPIIATGDMLRAAIAEGSILGKQVKVIMASGQLVSDEITIALVKERIVKPDCQIGFLLDGFPRTIPQAEALLQAGIDLDFVIEIKVADKKIITRLAGRRVHPASGRVYHIEHNPPRVVGRDDETGEELVQRDDDKETTIQQRLDVYHQQTEPLVNFYKNLNQQPGGHTQYRSVDGERHVEVVRQDILQLLTSL